MLESSSKFTAETGPSESSWELPGDGTSRNLPISYGLGLNLGYIDFAPTFPTSKGPVWHVFIIYYHVHSNSFCEGLFENFVVHLQIIRHIEDVIKRGHLVLKQGFLNLSEIRN